MCPLPLWSRAPHDRDAHTVVVVVFVERVEQFAPQLPVDRVAFLGPVQCDSRHVVGRSVDRTATAVASAHADPSRRAVVRVGERSVT